MEAERDPFNAVSNAVIITSMLEPTAETPQGKYRRTNLANIDCMSMVSTLVIISRQLYL